MNMTRTIGLACLTWLILSGAGCNENGPAPVGDTSDRATQQPEQSPPPRDGGEEQPQAPGDSGEVDRGDGERTYDIEEETAGTGVR